MREILFRGKRVDNGEWVEGGILVDGDYFAICVYSDYHGWHEFVEVIPETVGQYTGITDINGKKIFEGDIVDEYTALGKLGAERRLVQWSDLFGGWHLSESSSMYGGGICARYKVIGNIHDNPELLKGGAEE